MFTQCHVLRWLPGVSAQDGCLFFFSCVALKSLSFSLSGVLCLSSFGLRCPLSSERELSQLFHHLRAQFTSVILTSGFSKCSDRGVIKWRAETMCVHMWPGNVHHAVPVCVFVSVFHLVSYLRQIFSPCL